MEKILIIIKKIIPVKLFSFLQPAYHYLLAMLSAVIYGWPSEKLIVIGITGTTGKTTSVYLTARMLEHAGYRVGYTSTAFLSDGKKEWFNDKKMTMAGRFFTQKILRRMADNGCHFAIIETSSQGITQYRHRFINYDILVFTGLYPEHIEAHGSFADYKKAKGKLFAHLKKCAWKYRNENGMIVKKTGIGRIDLDRVKKTVIANGDDEHAGYFLDFWAEEKFVYTEESGPGHGMPARNLGEEVRIIGYSRLPAGGSKAGFIFSGTEIYLNLTGEFNAINAMNAACAGIRLGLTAAQIKEGLESVTGVAGRLENIDAGQDFRVIIDYAFEPGALEKIYETIRSISGRRIIHVLGSAGGGRDVARRPKLGELAGKNADYVIVTNEDPYDDDPETIIAQVALGAEKAGKKHNRDLFRIKDRREGIRKAIQLAEKDDIVLITGKGCEQAICAANGEKIPWDDRKIAAAIIEEELNKKYK